MILDTTYKKKYVSPVASIEYFTVDDVITTSGGQGRWDDDDVIINGIFYSPDEVEATDTY